MTASFISSAMDSDSDFGFGGSGDEDASFTQAHEEDVRKLDLAMCVSPSSNGSKMRSLWTNQMKS